MFFSLQIQYIVDLISLKNTMGWDANTTNLLKKYWTQGFSASQIAQKIGNVTRNAVIGKAHRLKLEARNTSRKPD